MPSTPSAPKITYRHNVGRGEHEIGVKVGKHFVPFVQVSDAEYASALERSENIAESGDEDEGEGE